MSELTTHRIERCINARSGKGLFRCGNDFCRKCSIRRTMFFCDNCKHFLHNVETPLFVTILIGPVKSYSIGVKDARCAIRRLNELGIDCIGVYEIATKEDTTEENWTNFMLYSGYDEAKHIGIGHLHILLKTSAEIKLRLNFPLTEQVVIKSIGTGWYSQFSMNDNKTRIIRYMRKRSPEQHIWLDQTNGEGQLVFRTDKGIVEILGDKSWYTVGQGWGDDFSRLQNRWIKGVMQCDENEGDSEGSVEEKGGGHYFLRVAGNCGNMMKGGCTNGQEIEENIDPVIAMIRRIHAEKHNAISPSTLRVVEDIKLDAVDEFFVMPSIQTPDKKKKKKKTSPYVTDANRDLILVSGMRAGEPIGVVCNDKEYMTKITAYGTKLINRLIASAIPFDEYELQKDKIDAERAKAIQSQRRRKEKNRRKQSRDSAFERSAREDQQIIEELSENA